MAVTDQVSHTFTKYLEAKRETILKKQKEQRGLAIGITIGAVVLGIGLFWYGVALLPVGLGFAARAWNEKRKFKNLDVKISQTKRMLRQVENEYEKVAIIEDYLQHNPMKEHALKLEKMLKEVKIHLARQAVEEQAKFEQMQTLAMLEEEKRFRKEQDRLKKEKEIEALKKEEIVLPPFKTLGQRRAEDAEKKRLEEEAKNLNRVSTDDLRKKVKVETPISEMERLNQKQEQLKKNNASPEEIDKVRNEKTNLAQQQLDSLMFGDRVKSSRQTKENPLEKPSQKSQP